MGVTSPWYKTVLDFFPKLKSGSVEAKAGIQIAEIGVKLDLDVSSGELQIQQISSKALELITRFRLNAPTYIMVDELEVFYINDQQYQRDLWMVRDLVFSVRELNRKFNQYAIPIYIVAAIRSEILYALRGTGQEIERVVEDNAEKLNWSASPKNIHHPLLNIVRKYLTFSEMKAGLPISAGDILFRYFPNKPGDRSIDTVLLDNSFFRPRDLVARMMAAREVFPNERSFSNNVLERTSGEYGRLIWIEVVYELSATYRYEEIEAIEALFLAKSPFFSKNDFGSRVDALMRSSSITRQLLTRHTVDELLKNLFRLGVIGNEWTERSSGRLNRWVFRGDQQLLLDRQMVLNRALWGKFAVRRRRPGGSSSRSTKRTS